MVTAERAERLSHSRSGASEARSRMRSHAGGTPGAERRGRPSAEASTNRVAPQHFLSNLRRRDPYELGPEPAAVQQCANVS